MLQFDRVKQMADLCYNCTVNIARKTVKKDPSATYVKTKNFGVLIFFHSFVTIPIMSPHSEKKTLFSLIKGDRKYTQVNC